MAKDLRIIAGGTGFIGSVLADRWLREGKQVMIVSRYLEKIEEIFGSRVHPMLWDDLADLDIDTISRADLIVNLAGESIVGGRWTNSRKKTIEDSRIDTSSFLAKCCAKWSAVCPPLFNASGIGIYGTQVLSDKHLPKAVDDLSPIDCSTSEFLPKMAYAWEMATKEAKDAGVRVVNMRFGVVLGKQGGALQQMALPFHVYLGGPIGSGRQPVSWISIDDVGAAIECLLEHPEISGPVNFVSPECVQQKEFAKALADALHKPCVVPTPAKVLELALGEMAQEVILNGQNVYPKRLLDAGFRFQYPQLSMALEQIYAR